jgi:predicted nucleic acid-binding protein
VPLGGEIIEVVAPFEDGTTAGRLLKKRGDGGYMIIMQNLDALKRKKHIEENKLGKVIWEHLGEDSHAVQYHPKGIKGAINLRNHHSLSINAVSSQGA